MMNYATATLRSVDLQALLAVSEQSPYRWLARPYPPHSRPNGRAYALPEVVARIRQRGAKSLRHGAAILKLVAFDAEIRAERESEGADFLWLGEGAEERSAAFFAVLSPEEAERAREVRKEVRNAAACAGLTGVDRLGHISLILPATVRYVLSAEANELPVGDAGWRSFTSALWAVNPATDNIMSEAA